MSKAHEYNALRAEILTHMQMNVHTRWSTAVATGAILAVGLSRLTPDPFVFLAPLLLIIPSMLTCAERSRGVRRIGCYIAVFHETDESEMRWERRNWQFLGGKGVVSFAKPWFRFLSTSLFVGLSLACLLLAWRAWQYDGVLFLLVLAVVFAALTYATCLTISVRSQCEDALKRWEEIKAQESASDELKPMR